VILMDEPSLGLSPKLTKEIFDIVVRINRERGVTILLVEQNAHMALKIADFGYVLEVGPHRDGGYRRAPGREGRYQGVLSRHEGRGRERSTAMETQEALAMTEAKGAAARGAADTVSKMFWRSVTDWAPQVSLRQKHFGIWQSITWREFGQLAREIGMGLVALGFTPGECASVLSNTNREWLYADMESSAPAAYRTASIRPTRPGRSSISAPTRARSISSSRTTSSSTRRSRCAPACRTCARSSCSTWTACATSMIRK
jgi:energy-coupling factor transporter ATP-binding protein EcfA2